MPKKRKGCSFGICHPLYVLMQLVADLEHVFLTSCTSSTSSTITDISH